MTESQMIAAAKAMFERARVEINLGPRTWDMLPVDRKMRWLMLAYHALLAVEKSK